MLRPHLEPLGFEPTDFKFGFSAYPLDENIDVDDIAGKNWYVMPAD